jgi:hypothetical protein
MEHTPSGRWFETAYYLMRPGGKFALLLHVIWAEDREELETIVTLSKWSPQTSEQNQTSFYRILRAIYTYILLDLNILIDDSTPCFETTSIQNSTIIYSTGI